MIFHPCFNPWRIMIHCAMSEAGHDPRAVANLILSETSQNGPGLTHLALQKLLYFAHGIYLMRTEKLLVSGYFEAWEHGPVHPTVYQSFKAAGGQPIQCPAKGRDALTGAPKEISDITDLEVIELIGWVMKTYGGMSSTRLVEISHAKNSPWDYVVDQASKNMVFGMRIGNDVITERFKFHKIAIGKPRDEEGPHEDAPLAGY